MNKLLLVFILLSACATKLREPSKFFTKETRIRHLHYCKSNNILHNNCQCFLDEMGLHFKNNDMDFNEFQDRLIDKILAPSEQEWIEDINLKCYWRHY